MKGAALNKAKPQERVGGRARGAIRASKATFIMAVLIIVLGFFLIYPLLLILINSFNVAPDMFVGPRLWGLDNWRIGFQGPRLLLSLWNTVMIFGLVLSISFPVSVVIAWTLARTRIPFSHGLEFLFWVSFMMPSIAVTVGWLMLADPRVGMLNVLLEKLPFIDTKLLNIYSIGGIVWVHLLGGIAGKVMLLTPAFRNMNAALEEAARVAGASNLGTMIRITLPVMIPPMVLVLALQLLHMFRSFETEQLLGIPFGFYVYSTMIFGLVRTNEPPLYGQATALAALTLLVIAFIIPMQRWLIHRRQYTTVTATFKPGLIDLGNWGRVILGAIVAILALQIVAPLISLILGSFMTRAGFFGLDPLFSMRHWRFVLADDMFFTGLWNTVVLSMTTALVSPILFSLIAYVLVRTRWRGRGTLDSIIWVSGAMPGMLSGLGLLSMYLGTPGLRMLYGTMWALVIVIILQGNTTGINITKGVFMQMGQELEEAARVSGAGWVRTYFRIWIPLMMPTLILIGTLNFVIAANTTSSIILLADRDTITLSIMALQFAGTSGLREEAGIVSLIVVVLTVGVALAARKFGLPLGVRHR